MTHGAREIDRAFPAPALESIVRPVDPGQITRLRAALEQLAEQDPLISLRQRNEEGEISLRLYGEVQKEVMTETLARDYGIGVDFGPTPDDLHRAPDRHGRARRDHRRSAENPFYATVGFRVEPAAPGAACGTFASWRVAARVLPRDRGDGARDVRARTVRLGGDRLRRHPHPRGILLVVSTAGDFRKLTPLVLMQALLDAGTEVCEPVEELELEIPEDTFGAVCGALLNARATMRNAFS